MWFVHPISASSTDMTFAYALHDEKVIVMRFKPLLPTSIDVVVCDANTIEIHTDAPFASSQTLSVKNLVDSAFLQIPDGFRFGTFMAKGRVLQYVHDFWNVPSIETKIGPEMILVRPREVTQYTLSV